MPSREWQTLTPPATLLPSDKVRWGTAVTFIVGDYELEAAMGAMSES